MNLTPAKVQHSTQRPAPKPLLCPLQPSVAQTDANCRRLLEACAAPPPLIQATRPNRAKKQ